MGIVTVQWDRDEVTGQRCVGQIHETIGIGADDLTLALAVASQWLVEDPGATIDVFTADRAINIRINTPD